jgi:hypothetical protein
MNIHLTWALQKLFKKNNPSTQEKKMLRGIPN